MSDGEATPEKTRLAPPWQPGQSGNPAGRPKGSRNKLGEAFIEALHTDFENEGAAAIVRCRVEKPDAYLKVIASILPKELKISNESDLSDDQLIERIRQLDSVIRPFLGSEGTGGAGVGTEPASLPN
jgi:hypothetical protein